MSLSDVISRGKVSRPRRTVLYGVPGIGKSTWASKAPSPVFVPTEDGVAGIECDKFPVAKSLQQFRENLNMLVKDGVAAGYKTVVVDSVDWLERLVHKSIIDDYNAANSSRIDSVGEIAWGKGVDQAAGMLAGLVRNLDWFVDAGMNVILIGHEHIESVSNPTSGQYDRFNMRLHKKSAPHIIEWADEVFYCRFKVRVREDQRGKRQAVSAGDRVMVCDSADPTVVAKNRLGMPHEIGFSWDEYSQYFSS